MPGWEQLGMQAASQATGALFGLALGRSQDQRQLNMERKLQRMNMQGSKEMTDYNMMKQLEMWRNTSYPAQMAMIKQAGLNPALMYGSSGPGGMTNLATGNVQQGAAPKGGGEIMGLMNMGLQSQMTQAQVELIKAQTAKTKAETGAVQPQIEKTQAETASITQGIENQKAQQELTEAQRFATNVGADIQARSANSQVQSWARRLENETEELRKNLRENRINDTTIQDKINQIKAESIGAAIENNLKQQNIQTQQAQIAKWIQELAQGWQQLSLQERNVKISEKLAEISGNKLTLEKQQTIIRMVESMMNRIMPAAGTVISQIKPAL